MPEAGRQAKEGTCAQAAGGNAQALCTELPKEGRSVAKPRLAALSKRTGAFRILKFTSEVYMEMAFRLGGSFCVAVSLGVPGMPYSLWRLLSLLVF